MTRSKSIPWQVALAVRCVSLPILVLRTQGGSQPQGFREAQPQEECHPLVSTSRIPAMKISPESNSRTWRRTEAKGEERLVDKGQGWRIAAVLECLLKPPHCAADWSRAESTEDQVAPKLGSESP